MGEWEFKSFAFDDVESIRFIVNSSKMEFEEYSGSYGDDLELSGIVDGERVLIKAERD